MTGTGLAQSPAEFFKGKTISLLIGFGAGLVYSAQVVTLP